MFMLGAAVVIIPVIFFVAGGPGMFEAGVAAGNVTPEQGSFFSSDAFLNQGAPYIAAVLAYAIGNQTIAQRLFSVREDLIKPTFVTATIGYGGSVIGIGMLGVMALYLGVDPLNGDVNNLIPQMAGTYLGPVLLALAFVMIIGALSSTADSDLAALSSIMMADVYGQSVGKKKANPKTMLLVGRVSMIIATAAALYFATAQFNILDLLVFVGALWGCLVFPVIASCVELLATIGIGVVLGIMSFGFFGLKPAVIIGGVATVVAAPFTFFFLRDYTVLSASLVAYAVSFLVCYFMSFRSKQDFDFDVIKDITGDFDPETPVAPEVVDQAKLATRGAASASRTD